MIKTAFNSEFSCSFCEKTFSTELGFIKHKCQPMKRAEESRTLIGQNAFSFYQKWLKMQRKVAPSVSTFLKSKYYVSFMKFAEFAKQVKLTEIDMFIKMMVSNSIQPQIWTNDQMYVLYLEYLDHTVAPTKQVNITVKYLFKLADAFDCSVGEVFDLIHPNELLQMIRERKLSPWLLLRSKKFNEFLNRLNEDEYSLFEELIRPQYWAKKFEKNPRIVDIMKKCVTELEI